MAPAKCPCRGGFCGLVLPKNPLLDGPANKKAPLSKREKRLRRGRERDRAVKLLKWVLTEEEYASLEETGDLVRLRVKRSGGSADDEDGFWMDGAAVGLARREHRPDLARLAFAEFQSSGEGGDGGDLGSDEPPACHATTGPQSGGPKHVTEPYCAGKDGDVVVCETCFIVYTLLGQARELMAAHQTAENDATTSDAGEGGDNQPGEDQAADSLENMDDAPSSPLKKCPTAGPGSSEWEAAKQPIASPASFHGPISPQHKRKEENRPKTTGKRARRRKRERERKQANSNIHILVAESDEVSASIDVCAYLVHILCNTHRFRTHHRPRAKWPSVCSRRRATKSSAFRMAAIAFKQ